MSKNIMVKFHKEGEAMFSFPEARFDASEFIAIDPTLTIKTWQPGRVPFEELPAEIQAEVLDTLKAYDRCSVEYYGYKFYTTVGCCIRSTYPSDFVSCGTYLAKDLYTPEQRQANYIQCFG